MSAETKPDPLPTQGGSYERQEGGELKLVESTADAEDRAAPEPDGRGTAQPAQDEPQRQPRRSRQEPQE